MWDRRPTDDELTCRRLQEGWKPVPTQLVDGPTILGNAARWVAGSLVCAAC